MFILFTFFFYREPLDKTYVYEYNSIGNITKVKNYHYRLIDPLTNCSTDTEYTYDTTHPDRLIAVDGNSITYNSLGCVETYKGKRYDWERGRLVKVRQGNKNAAEGAYEECTFTYDGYGRRMQKSYLTGYNYPAEDAAYNSSTTNTVDYTYDNSGRLIRELRTNVIQYGTTTTTTRELIYLYDESGMIGVMHNSQPYYYHRNLQGDVIAIYDANGEKRVEYAYDAWGNCEIVYGENSNLASLNPIRYRGYYYDTETDLYYLNARYYSPEWRRFISLDIADYIDPETPNGLNLYAYCGNDPINRIDPLGCDWWNPFTWDWQGAFNSIGTAFSEAGQWLNSNVLIPVGNFFVDNWDIVLGVTATIGIAALGIATFGFANIGIGMLIGGIVGVGFGALNAYINGDSVLYGAISGGIVGVLSGIGNLGLKGMMFAGVASALGAATASLVGDRINNRPRNFKAAGLSAVTAGVFSFMGNGYGNYLSSMGPELAIKIAGNSMGAFYFSSYIFVADSILNKALGG